MGLKVSTPQVPVGGGHVIFVILSLIASLCHIRMCQCICTYYRYGIDTG